MPHGVSVSSCNGDNEEEFVLILMVVSDPYSFGFSGKNGNGI